jgi:predicted lysophospholipase L1 biosynthesis ABC-type transport system permease subunit
MGCSLAVLSAALGVVNTSVISTTERRREMGILRAAGTDRSQVRRILMVEGSLVGALGALVGTLAGAGVVMLYVVTSAGAARLPDFPAWLAALSSAEPALLRRRWLCSWRRFHGDRRGLPARRPCTTVLRILPKGVGLVSRRGA